MTLHANEVPAGETVVRALLAAQRPEWARLPLTAAGAGTDNSMYRLGDELLVRLPRTPDTARSVRKEQHWLPRLAPRLGSAVPEPVHLGVPGPGFPLAWSVYRWIDGAEPGPDTVRDWAAFGGDLAAFVRELHGLGLMGASRADDLDWYRGGGLRACDDWVTRYLADCREPAGAGAGAAGSGARADAGTARDPDTVRDPDVDALEHLWRAALALPESDAPHVWLHGDLKPSNLLVRDGRLHAVIDFGCLSIGLPDAEHAPVWDLPAAARRAYRDALDLDEPTWIRARAWAIAVGVSGLAHYRHTWPAFAAECLARLRAILAEAG
ncbi:aminoglycoside phosphotransferase family protein [Kitasatospora sp. NPDC056327]|uniref:aminoglycoside phosphotransferase family protein n=1 Tax=Kitasatospora sp. NPDC056327 TaxID=3345785 RepID=UPI0035E2B732